MAKNTKKTLYTDAYYAKDGYRTKQFTAKLNADPHYAPLQENYTFNEFSNRAKRRQIARTKGVFGLHIWKDTVKNLKNVQTYAKERV